VVQYAYEQKRFLFGKEKMARMLFMVLDDNGHLVHLCEKEQYAKNFIELYGNENYTIQSEEMC